MDLRDQFLVRRADFIGVLRRRRPRSRGPLAASSAFPFLLPAVCRSRRSLRRLRRSFTARSRHNSIAHDAASGRARTMKARKPQFRRGSSAATSPNKINDFQDIVILRAMTGGRVVALLTAELPATASQRQWQPASNNAINPKRHKALSAANKISVKKPYHGPIAR